MTPEDRDLVEAIEEADQATAAAMKRIYHRATDPRRKSEHATERAGNVRKALARRGYLIVDVRGAGPQARDGWRA